MCSSHKNQVAMANALGVCPCAYHPRTFGACRAGPCALPSKTSPKHINPEPQAPPLDEVDSVAQNQESEAFVASGSLATGVLLGSRSQR